MAARTGNRSGFAVLAEATTRDISLIGTKRDGESLQVERTPKRLRNDDQERCDAIDTIGSAIIAQVGLADDAVFRTVTVTGREPAITEVTKALRDALQQYTEPANTQTLTHQEEMNCKRVLREVLVAFTRVCGARAESRTGRSIGSPEQQWIQDAEEAKLLVTYDKYEATVTELSAKDAELTESIQALTDRDTAFAGELATVRADLTAKNTALVNELDTVRSELSAKNTALASELESTKNTVEVLTKKNTELEAKNVELAAAVRTLIKKVDGLTEKVAKLAPQ
ncbi:hypothetical protein FN846DRAFT_906507 [Sphaerosporella brunnea]|uniref:Uncharacterized protein n=1 Tax=Sphaerosporella brunnea TaxID=1250544 RepID=A0A5J5EYP2_9PEZI|nr:hypothetical protein FN846DRAFT_906507 [Sphaerosporella brunnea]